MSGINFFPGLFTAGLSPDDVMVQASMALPLCLKILEGRLTIVSPLSRETEQQQQLPEEEEAKEEREEDEEESLLCNRLSPIPLEFYPWLEDDSAVRLSGVPAETPLALIKASLLGEGVPFRWVSWSAAPGEALVEARGPKGRRSLLKRGVSLCGGGPRLRARPAYDDEPGYIARSVSAPEGLLEATRCAPIPGS